MKHSTLHSAEVQGTRTRNAARLGPGASYMARATWQLSKDTVVSKASRDSKWRLSTKQKAEVKQGWMIARFLFPQSNLSEVTFATNSAVFLQALHAQLRKTGSEKFPLKGRIMASQTDRSIKPRNAKNQLC